LQIGSLKDSSKKGKHTTVVRELFPLAGGGYVADMPGLRSLSLWDTEPEELDGYFPELRTLVPHCQFNDCTHIVEPGCAVKEAVENGTVSPERYESYVRLRLGDEE
jgi:ribosome biogenesis GTPase